MKSTLEHSTSSPLGVIGFSSIDLNCQIYACEDLSEDLFTTLTMFIAAWNSTVMWQFQMPIHTNFTVYLQISEDFFFPNTTYTD